MGASLDAQLPVADRPAAPAFAAFSLLTDTDDVHGDILIMRGTSFFCYSAQHGLSST